MAFGIQGGRSTFDTRRKTVGAKSNATQPFGFQPGMHWGDYLQAQRRLGSTAQLPAAEPQGPFNPLGQMPSTPSVQRGPAMLGSQLQVQPAQMTGSGGQADPLAFNSPGTSAANFIQNLRMNPAASRGTPMYSQFQQAGQAMAAQHGIGQRGPRVPSSMFGGTSYSDMPGVERENLGMQVAAIRDQQNSSMPMGTTAGFMPERNAGGQLLTGAPQQQPAQGLSPGFLQRQQEFMGQHSAPFSSYTPTASMRDPRGAGGLISNTGPLAQSSMTQVVPGQFGGPRFIGPTADMEPEQRQAYLQNQLANQQQRVQPYLNRREAVDMARQDRFATLDGISNGRLDYLNTRREARGMNPLSRDDKYTPAERPLARTPQQDPNAGGVYSVLGQRRQAGESLMDNAVQEAANAALAQSEQAGLTGIDARQKVAEALADTAFAQVNSGVMRMEDAIRYLEQYDKEYPLGVKTPADILRKQKAAIDNRQRGRSRWDDRTRTWVAR